MHGIKRCFYIPAHLGDEKEITEAYECSVVVERSLGHKFNPQPWTKVPEEEIGQVTVDKVVSERLL